MRLKLSARPSKCAALRMMEVEIEKKLCILLGDRCTAYVREFWLYEVVCFPSQENSMSIYIKLVGSLVRDHWLVWELEYWARLHLA